MFKVEKLALFSALSFCGGGGSSSGDNNDSNGTFTQPPPICYWFPESASENPFCYPGFKKADGSVTVSTTSSSASK